MGGEIQALELRCQPQLYHTVPSVSLIFTWTFLGVHHCSQEYCVARVYVCASLLEKACFPAQLQQWPVVMLFAQGCR